MIERGIGFTLEEDLASAEWHSTEAKFHIAAGRSVIAGDHARKAASLLNQYNLDSHQFWQEIKRIEEKKEKARAAEQMRRLYIHKQNRIIDALRRY